MPKAALLPAMILVVACAATSLVGQSLAEVAKKGEEERAKAKQEQSKAADGKDADKAEKPTATKVYTDKNLKPSARDAVAAEIREATSTSVTAATVAGTAAVVDTEPTSSTVTEPAAHITLKTEAQWKGRRAELQTQLDSDQTLAAVALSRERALDAQLHRNVDDILFIRDRLRRAEIDHQWQEAVTELGRIKAAVLNDIRAINMLEEQSRRAGVPPGWLRP